MLQGQPFTVTGHSLGGYLGVAVKSSFPQVTQGFLFNAPGVGGVIGNLADSLAGVLGLGSISTDNLWNVRGSEGISIIAGLGYQLGTAVNIQTEAINSHGIGTLVDALAVQALYAKLIPALTADQLNALIDAFGSAKDTTGTPIAKTLESALDALRTIILNPGNETPEDREVLYSHLNSLQNSQEFSGLSGAAQLIPLPGLSSGEMITMATANSAQGLAARYALTTLNPFVLKGADYSVLNNTGALDRFQSASGTGMITDQYLLDRASMLVRKLWFNINDENPYNPFAQIDIHNMGVHPYLKSDIYFEDATTGYKIQQGTLFGNTPRYFFGSDAAETPTGSAVKDYLYGSGGNDTLQGLKGNDYLEGGTGTDTYIINPGDGIDTVLDTDGLGAIQLGSVTVQGRDSVAVDKDWIKIGGSWIDRQNSLEYLLLPQNNGSNDLLIKSADGSGVLIKAWQDGQLSITLGENTPPSTPGYERTILGDLQPDDVNADADGVQIGFDELGNVIVGMEEAPDRKDRLFGSGGNDLIQGFGGNDDIFAKDGDDRIEGGAGQDNLAGGAGNDSVLGGAGSDIVAGNEGDDRLYADAEYTLDEAYTLGETQPASGQRGDLLNGGAGDDILIGEADEDILMGGLGKDVLMGLGGDDVIEGDASVNVVDRNWGVIRDETLENNAHIYSRSYSFTSTVDTIVPDMSGDDDVIYGGAGNDWIFAQGGNDFIDAGADHDVVFGGSGNDVILGQAGDDVIVGDGHPSILAASLHGDDYLSGGNGDDQLYGGGGSDYLEGGAGNDILHGDFSDIAFQYHGNDILDGGSGDDRLSGYAGNDTLIGGSGNDTLIGGSGDDIYIGVEKGDVIVDLLGRSTIILADANSVAANPANQPLGLALATLSFDEPAATPGNAPIGAMWEGNSKRL